MANAATDDLSADFCLKPYDGHRPADGFRLILRSGFQGRFSGIGWGGNSDFPTSRAIFKQEASEMVLTVVGSSGHSEIGANHGRNFHAEQ
ncbi:MAG: hypothetical protein WBN02_06640 [Sedimenticolaceae bacterium]